MKDKSLISILVISYNSSQTIIDTLDSIKKQTYGTQNIQLIISDDCSTDNTEEKIEIWIQGNEKYFFEVSLVTGKINTGPAGNCNRALNYVKGEYVELTAGDDKLLPDTIDKYVKFFENNPEYAIPMGKVVLDIHDNIEPGNFEIHCSKCYDFAQLTKEKQFLKILSNNLVLSTAVMYRSSIFKEVRFDERYPFMEDYPLIIKILQKGYYFSFLDEDVINYRISNTGLSSGRDISNRTLKSAIDFYFHEKWKLLLKNKQFKLLVIQSCYYLKKLLQITWGNH